MSTNEERREAAKRKLEERLETERLARRKRKIVIASVSTAVVVAVVAGVTAVVVKKIMDEHGARIELRNRQSSTTSGTSGTDTVGAQVSILFVKLA